MSITLLCLVKGNTTANAFEVDIEKDKSISKLKEAIKEKIDVPANFKAKDLKVWKVSIPDDRDDLLSNLTLNDGGELLATRDIEEYWPEKPPKRHIHVIVKLPRKCLVQSVQSALTANFSSFALIILTRIRFQFSAWKRRCRVFRHFFEMH